MGPNIPYSATGTAIADGSLTLLLPPDVPGIGTMNSSSQGDVYMLSCDSTSLPTYQFDNNIDIATLSYSEVLEDILGSLSASPMAFEAALRDEAAGNF